MIIVAGYVEVAPSDRRPFLARAAEAIIACRSQEGCLDYSLSKDAESPGTVRIFELWADEGSLERHVASVAAGGGPPHSVPIVSERLVRYDVASSDDLVRVDPTPSASPGGGDRA